MTGWPLRCVEIRVAGHVQGVGFRPFVYRLARRLGLSGTVQNRTGEVVIKICGAGEACAEFESRLVLEAPPIASVRVVSRAETRGRAFEGFSILDSDAHDRAAIHVPPDFFTCADCLNELSDPAERRFRYPFINCTQCGPRYTIIHALPYDRPATSMSGFELCADCMREYTDPMDRRFHAQPLACPACGPRLVFSGAAPEGSKDALENALLSLRRGDILAVKGVGGYHLMCDARNVDALSRLRRRKRRPHKPLAVMVPAGDAGAAVLDTIARADADQLSLLHAPSRPVVLVGARPNALPREIAPGLGEIGVMLPYSPLHHLLLDGFGDVLVATSGNISGEPVLTERDEAAERLGAVADAFLHHDRPIVRPADDSVYRKTAGKLRPLRLGRGVAPLELTLPREVPQPVIAAGSHMKNTVALAWGDRVVVSPHIGDLDSVRSLTVHRRVIDDLQRLYQVRATACVRDAHRDYGSSQWAESCGLPVSVVHHHRAHASALAAEYGGGGSWLVFAWDGVGLGEDGTLWGGETFYGGPGCWRRVATLRSFRLPGGERAAREPWRSAAALKWELGERAVLPAGVDGAVLRQAWRRGINAPATSAAGRLFDAAASLTGIMQTASFEGQGPMLLEQASDSPYPAPALPIVERDGLLVADWESLVPELEDERNPVAVRAAHFHARMAHTLAAIAELCSRRHSVERVGMCGGVFQNRVLCDYAVSLLGELGFEVCLPLRVPVNDAAIALGQIVEFASLPS